MSTEPTEQELLDAKGLLAQCIEISARHHHPELIAEAQVKIVAQRLANDREAIRQFESQRYSQGANFARAEAKIKINELKTKIERLQTAVDAARIMRSKISDKLAEYAEVDVHVFDLANEGLE